MKLTVLKCVTMEIISQAMDVQVSARLKQIGSALNMMAENQFAKGKLSLFCVETVR